MKITDERVLRKLLGVFSVVAESNGLAHIGDNMFRDPQGRKYYLDTLGFHTASQYSNLELVKREEELSMEIKKYNRLLARESLGMRSRTKLLEILQDKYTSLEWKCNKIRNYLTNASAEDITE